MRIAHERGARRLRLRRERPSLSPHRRRRISAASPSLTPPQAACFAPSFRPPQQGPGSLNDINSQARYSSFVLSSSRKSWSLRLGGQANSDGKMGVKRGSGTFSCFSARRRVRRPRLYRRASAIRSTSNDVIVGSCQARYYCCQGSNSCGKLGTGRHGRKRI